jgi:hypothetical protein
LTVVEHLDRPRQDQPHSIAVLNILHSAEIHKALHEMICSTTCVKVVADKTLAVILKVNVRDLDSGASQNGQPDRGILDGQSRSMQSGMVHAEAISY